jgi:hypothetical protein
MPIAERGHMLKYLGNRWDHHCTAGMVLVVTYNLSRVTCRRVTQSNDYSTPETQIRTHQLSTSIPVLGNEDLRRPSRGYQCAPTAKGLD